MRYQFIQPVQATVRRENDSTLIGYGIGDFIEVKDFSGREDPLYHPMLNECLSHNQEIPMTDGSYVTFHGLPKLVAEYSMVAAERCGPW